MGLLDVFSKKEEDSKIDELIKEIINIYGKDEPYSNLIKYIEKKEYIFDFSLIDEDNMIKAFKIMAKLLKKNSDIIDYAKTLYDLILISSAQKDIDLFIKTLKKCENKDFIVMLKNIANLFSDKNIAINLTSDLIKSGNSSNFLEELNKYMVIARIYYVDEVAFLSRILEIMNNLKYKSLDCEKLKEAFLFELEKDKMQAGIYPNIDEDRLFELNKRIDNATKSIDKVDSKLSQINIEMINISTNIEKRIQTLIFDKTKSFEDKYASFTQIMEDARNNSLQVTSEAKKEIEALGEHYLNLLSDKAVSKGAERVNSSDVNRTPIVSTETNRSLREYTTNTILDGGKYSEILNKVKGSNMYFHKGFEKALKYVLVKKAVMLVGPRGSGKSYLAEQIANILNLDFYNLGIVSDEHETIKGFIDANGNFVKTPFYNAFKNGGLCFLDEIDASESRALLELHKIVDTIGYHPYIFPNCEKVNPHPNFTIVAAANTWGTGGDRNYTAREKMDDATIHKFMQVSYDYDDNLSKKFLSNHSDILEVINYYNQALKEHGNNNILSPGDMSLISYFLNTNIVTWNDIIEDMLIRNNQTDTLNSIINNMDSHIKNNQKFNEFKQKVKTR